MKRFAVPFVIAAFLCVAACSTAKPVPDRPADTNTTALILAGENVELHYKDGKVYVIDGDTRREVANYKEFRGYYLRERTDAPPEEPPDGTVEVTGWRGLECVRKGITCGRMPEPHSRGDAVRVRLVFPNRR